MKIERIYIEKEIDEYGYEEANENYGRFCNRDSFTIQRATGYVLGEYMHLDDCPADPREAAAWWSEREATCTEDGQKIMAILPYRHFVDWRSYEYFRPMAGGNPLKWENWGHVDERTLAEYGPEVAPYHYGLQDWKRAEEFNDGHFWFERLRAVAELDAADSDQYIKTEWSYSFEDEDDLTIREYTEEKLNELTEILIDMGFDQAEIAPAIKEVETYDS